MEADIQKEEKKVDTDIHWDNSIFRRTATSSVNRSTMGQISKNGFGEGKVEC